MAPMVLSDFEVKTCSKTCLKNHETLKTQYDKLRIEFNKSESDLYNYKRGLASVEERLVFYKNNEVIFTDQIAVLKRDASFNEAEIIALKSYIKKLKKEKEDNLLKINNYDNATKSFDKVIGSQLVDNNKKGLGYNVVPRPLTGLFAPAIIDLSHSGIEKFKEPEFEGFGSNASKNVNTGAPIIKDWESDNDDEDDKPKPKVVKKTIESKTVKQDVVSDGKLKKKTVFPTAAKIEVQKPIWNNARRVNHHNFNRMSYPHPHPNRNFVPKAVLMKTGMRPVNASKPKAAYNVVKRNSASVTLKRLDYIDAQGRFKSVMAWMDAQAQGREECNKEKEDSREECSKSTKTKKMKCLEESS
ncbi:hypothetical protein Tco_1474944 [Tanacetum coccineum]